jgi:diadenylate cyclase
MEPIHLTGHGIVEFAALLAVSYSVLRLTRLVRALRIAGVLGFVYGAAVMAGHLGLVITSRALEDWVYGMLMLVVVVFQPEIRRALLRADVFSLLHRLAPSLAGRRNGEIARAAFALAEEKTGALIILLKRVRIDDFAEGGIDLSANVTTALLCSIFQKSCSMHDGAVLIHGNVLTRAGVILPLTEQSAVPAHFGTRHRAAMGIAERSDAAVVVVSEQRGEVTFIGEDRSVTVRSEDELIALLSDVAAVPRRSLFQRCGNWLSRDWKLKAGAFAEAILILAGTDFLSGNSERVIAAPVEFDNLPPNVAPRLRVIRSCRFRFGAEVG